VSSGWSMSVTACLQQRAPRLGPRGRVLVCLPLSLELERSCLQLIAGRAVPHLLGHTRQGLKYHSNYI